MKLSRVLVVTALALLPATAFAQTGPTFVPLTSIPVLHNFTATTSLPALLSYIYKICIGLAATLAVLQIMRAGVLYMGGDSITEKKEARALISTSIVGLILVLSPYIVFSIINPSILNLDISKSASQLDVSSFSSAPSFTSGQAVSEVPATSAQDCAGKGGTYTNGICTVPTNSAAASAATACTNFNSFEVTPSGADCTYTAGDSYVKVNDQCCAGIQSGNQCCAKDNAN